MNNRKKRLAATLIVVALVISALQVTRMPRFEWRAKFMAAKLSGERPGLSWLDLFRLTYPSRFYEAHLSAPFNHLMPVRVEQYGQDPCPVLWGTPLGQFWGRRDDGRLLMFLSQEQAIDNIYEQDSVVVRNGDVVVDGGADLGTFSRFALNRGARLVVAFEPEPTNIACLKRTFGKETQEGRVILVEAALWDSPGSLDFALPETGNSGTGSVAISKPRRTIQVQATTLDETVARLKLDHVDFIKMDIEGAEKKALLGGRSTISRWGPRMAISTEHLDDDDVAIVKLVLGERPSYRVFAFTGSLSGSPVALFY